MYIIYSNLGNWNPMINLKWNSVHSHKFHPLQLYSQNLVLHTLNAPSQVIVVLFPIFRYQTLCLHIHLSMYILHIVVVSYEYWRVYQVHERGKIDVIVFYNMLHLHYKYWSISASIISSYLDLALYNLHLLPSPFIPKPNLLSHQISTKRHLFLRRSHLNDSGILWTTH